MSCMKCKHFKITYDQNAPRGCNLYQIKSSQMPSIIVKQATGHECTEFELHPNQAKKNEKDKLDFNDPKFWGKS